MGLGLWEGPSVWSMYSFGQRVALVLCALHVFGAQDVLEEGAPE